MDRARLSRFLNQPLNELSLEAPAVVSPSDPVRRAVALMQEGSRSYVLVMEDGRLAGIFTERDVLAKCMQDGFDWDQPARTVMTGQPATVSPTGTVAEAIAAVQQHAYRTLVVTEGERVVGVIRVGDLLRHLAESFPEDVLNLPPRPHQVMDKQEGG